MLHNTYFLFEENLVHTI